MPIEALRHAVASHGRGLKRSRQPAASYDRSGCPPSGIEVSNDPGLLGPRNEQWQLVLFWICELLANWSSLLSSGEYGSIQLGSVRKIWTKSLEPFLNRDDL